MNNTSTQQPLKQSDVIGLYKQPFRSHPIAEYVIDVIANLPKEVRKELRTKAKTKYFNR